LETLFRTTGAISVPTYGLNRGIPAGNGCRYLAGIGVHCAAYLNIDGEYAIMVAQGINIFRVNKIKSIK